MSRKLDFKMIYSPYSQNNDEDISVLYDEYRKDKNAVVSIDAGIFRDADPSSGHQKKNTRPSGFPRKSRCPLTTYI